VFAALAHKPALIEPMRAVYSDLYKRLEEDDLPPGVAEVIAAAADGLWLNWVLGLVPVDQARMTRVQKALERLLVPDEPARQPTRSTPPARKKPAAQTAKAARKRPGGRRS
jgi:hypothetical protein